MVPESRLQRPTAAESLQRAAVIARYALDQDAVAEISALHRSTPMSFVEAAIHLGFVPSSPKPAPDTRIALHPTPVPTHSQPLALRSGPRLPPGIESRSEMIRSLRTELLMRQEDRDSTQQLAILSPGAGEGRSQLAAELAIAFSQLGEPTLLVDADLRHARQHQLFGASNEQGLGLALSGEDAALPLAVSGPDPLFLLCAGPPPSNPLERLSDPQFDRLLSDWRQRYRYIVVDTPPVGRYADALAVAHRVGRVIALSRAHHTTYRETRELLRRLSATRSRILGAVINRF